MISLRDVVTGFGSRDPLAEVWRRSLRGGGGGSAVISGVPPLRYIGDGRPLTDYLISGNAVQDGTPSPDAPVDATGCGVRTGNLFDGSISETSKYLNHEGDTLTSSAFNISDYIPCNAETTYTVEKVNSESVSPSVCFYSLQQEFLGGINYNRQSGITFDTPANCAYLKISYRKNTAAQATLNLGSTALPYEPYGYKLPLTVNGTEYPIYLGTVPTTRRVKKLVLTGKEAWRKDSDTELSARYYITISDIENSTANLLSSHFTQSTQYEIGTMRVYRKMLILSVDKNIYATVADWKSYLAAQYAAGTHVTVWYVLAEPETGIVNEPLMKIGDYADTVSFAQAGMTIPTVSGENVLDVPTEVKPSQITIKGGIRSV